jgi:hypothetical protein
VFIFVLYISFAIFQITMCDQLAAYLAKFVAQEGATAETAPVEVAPPAGFKPLAKAIVGDDPDAWMLGVGKGKGAKGKGKAGGKKIDSKPSPPEKLIHSLDMLGAFATLKLEVPTTGAQVPVALTGVKSKKEHYLGKREEEKKKAAEKETEAAAAPTDAPADPPGDADAPEAAAAPAAAGPSSKGKSGGKAAATAALKLDDEASWPTMGGAPNSKAPEPPSGWGASASSSAPAATAVLAASADIAVSLSVEDDGAVALAIS